MPEELQAMHESIHVRYRQKLSDLEWELAQSLARENVKDGRIAELVDLLDVATTPEA